MSLSSKHNFPPRLVFQYMAGAPTLQTHKAGLALHTFLAQHGIFTRMFGSGFADEPGALPATVLPSHSDFVLMVHDANALTPEDFIFLANLSAPLLLLHYTDARNINAGLARWGLVTAALGMDQTATMALRTAGFDTALTLLLPEPEKENFNPTQDGDSVNAGAPFTISAPGDLTAQSGVVTLLDGFIRFRQSFGQPCRLVLLGRTLDARTAKAVQDRITAESLGDEVTITGGIDDECRDNLIATSDLVVVRERGDMLAPAKTLMIHELGETGLADGNVPGVEEVAEAFRSFAESPARLAELSNAQQDPPIATRSAALAAKILFNALGRCGFALPVPAAERLQVLQQLGFIVAGHFEGSYSIAAVNRLLAAALEQRRQGSVQVLPVAFHQRLDVLQEIPADQEILQQRLFARHRPDGAPVIAISQHFPPWRPDIPHDLALSLFTWEETLVPAAIVDTINAGFGGVLAVSRFVAKALVDSGVHRPVAVVGQAVEAGFFQALAAERSAKRDQAAPTEPFTALHVSSCFLRKGADVLLAAWAKAFTADDPVRLVIKTFPNPHHSMADDLDRVRAANPHLATICLIDEDLDQTALLALYRQADCMVLPTRGEGFNMVAAESILAQLPLIVTGFGGHLEFAGGADVRLLDFRLAASRSHVAGDGALWAEPDVEDLIAALREAFAAHQNKPSFQPAFRTPEIAAAAFSGASWAARIAEFAAGLITDPPRKLRRIAWISSWGIRCGIAEYSRALLEHRAAGGDAPEILLLCDTRSRVAITPQEPLGVTVLPAWSLGSRRVARDIAPHLTVFDPQILLVQHQDGLISWEDLLEIIASASGTPARLIIVLHSTAAILALYHKLQASVLFSLSLVARVIVHTLEDVENLRQNGLVDNVTLLPHGAGAAKLPTIAACAANRQSLVLGCYGFFLPHKGIATLIEAFAGVLEEWPAARLRLVTAAFPSDVSAAEVNACRALARRLQIDHAVDWHLRYLEEAESKALLAECDLIVMPYDHSPESVSGAVRHALASGSPVAVSHSPIFNELNDAVHRVNATNPGDLAHELAGLLRDVAKCRSTLQAAGDWLGRHRWSDISKRLFNMAEGLWRMPSETPPRRLVLTPRSRLLETNIGRRIGRHLVISGDVAGFGVYGPYVNLAAGSYKAAFRFERYSERRGSARFEAASQISNITIATLERVFPDGEGDMVILEFFLAQPVPEVEFRIFCEAGFYAVFESLSIELLATTIIC